MGIYNSIREISDAAIVEKGSRFIGIIFPCDSASSFEHQLKEIQKEHPSAVHHCYAYRIGSSKVIERANDDGEPAGTAGKPILNQLISSNLKNVGLIVVRYFGGTLLGTSGLIKAYKSVSKQCIAGAKVIEVAEKISLKIECKYEALPVLMQAIKKRDYTILRQDIALLCKFEIEIPLEEESSFRAELSKDAIQITY